MKEYIQESEKDQILQERLNLDEKIKNYNFEVERIKEEEIERRKRHQDDLKYQMMQKEKQRQKEIQDKIYEERAAKLWEMEYQKKINQQKELHLQRVRIIIIF
jgi:hypothetical protein